MAKKKQNTSGSWLIHSPVSDYSGISAGLQFVNGTAKTDIPWLVNWFERHGYEVKEIPNQEAPPQNPPAEEQPETSEQEKPAAKK